MVELLKITESNHGEEGSLLEMMSNKYANSNKVNALVYMFLFSGVSRMDGLLQYSLNIRVSNVAGVARLKKLSLSHNFISDSVDKLSSVAVCQKIKDNIFKRNTFKHHLPPVGDDFKWEQSILN